MMKVTISFWLLQIFFVRPTISWFTTPWKTTQSTTGSLSIPKNVRLLILPGFGNDSTDYVLNQAPQGSLVLSLKSKGWDDDQICVLPVERSDWWQVFQKGLLDINFWRGNADPTRPAFAWYLQRVSKCIKELTSDEDSLVVLIGHSAGGWLARAALGFGSAGEETCPAYVDLNCVLGLVTLGAPHLPPPPQVMDMTRGALRITNERFPGAFHLEDGVFYITVMGDAVQGVKQEGMRIFQPTTVNDFAYTSYQAVCGQGGTIGDGVVPLSAGHLTEAVNLNLEGIFHSINVPDRWYGSRAVVDLWHSELLRQIKERMRIRLQERNSFQDVIKSLLQRKRLDITP